MLLFWCVQAHGEDNRWQAWRLLTATVQYPGHDSRKVDLSMGTLQQPLNISAPAVLRLTVTVRFLLLHSKLVCTAHKN